MHSLRTNQPTFEETLLQAELEMMVREIPETFTQQNSQVLQSGSILYKVPFHRTSVQTLLSDNTATCCSSESMTTCSQDDLLPQVTDKFINIPCDLPYFEALQLAENFRAKAGKHLYGVLFRSTLDQEVILNPFHILTTLETLSNQDSAFLINHKFNILVYVYRDRTYADDLFQTSSADLDAIERNINALMHTYTSRSFLKSRIVKSEQDDDGVRVTYQSVLDPDDDPDYIYQIVATQLLTKGIIAPYYGTSLIRWSTNRNNCGGIHLSPFRSVNIKSESSTARDTSTQSVCTGDLSNTTSNGLRTLHHANLSSAWNSTSLVPGALAYADAMIAKSANLYLSASVIQPCSDTVEVKPDFTDEELACTTLAEFTKLKLKPGIRNLPLTEIKKAWDELQAHRETVTEDSQDPIADTVLFVLDTPFRIGDYIEFSYTRSNHRDTWRESNKGRITSFTDTHINYTTRQGDSRTVSITGIRQVHKPAQS